ncbi:MAG: HAD family phosphatase, partial [Lachnospiraceae bacterium]|nr:HAD family phosphatase [Candidatus Hippenecus merdae]
MRDFRELPLKGAIFDFDGTLVDSMYMWKEIDREYLKKYGHEMTDDLQQAIEGMSQDEMSEYFRNR